MDTTTLTAGFNRFREKYGLSGSALKIIAIITMLIDHTAAALLMQMSRYTCFYSDPEKISQIRFWYGWMRKIGRIAFPIFCFFIIEGFLHTRDVKQYAKRLFIFALISQFPFMYALHPGQPIFSKLNVYFTLLIGLLVLIAVREMNGRIWIQGLFLCAGMILANLLKTDYAWHGVFLIELLYILRFSRLFQCLCGGAFMEYEGIFGTLAFVPVLFYNGKRGRQIKYFFYAFYPGHLLLLGIIRNIIFPAVFK